MALVLLVLLFSCSKDTNNGGTNNGGTNGAQLGPLFTEAKSVISANCAVSGCHAGSSPQNGINFNDNATIVAQRSNIKTRAVDQAGTPNQMPPPPRQPLSAADQKKITDWITAGGRTSD
jgi:uncharacterized membrane protein